MEEEQMCVLIGIIAKPLPTPSKASHHVHTVKAMSSHSAIFEHEKIYHIATWLVMTVPLRIFVSNRSAILHLRSVIPASYHRQGVKMCRSRQFI